ncbi:MULTISPECIES: hypothetical protein [Synechococcales]|uniref:hypothetical protein n=1 Tax=Synechococcus sp. CS-1333 TaxID=2848638 RepID=UPI00223B5646|nr:hypothetical protein [Synechococcus sp. CS-1333]
MNTAKQVMKLFAVAMAKQSNYYDDKKTDSEHDQNQLDWFREQAQNGTLLLHGHSILMMAQGFGSYRQKLLKLPD